MIGESVPDAHKQVIAQLNAQIKLYLATGERIHIIPTGQSGEKSLSAVSNHPKNLKTRRDKHVPKVRTLAAEGKTASAIATALGIDSRTIRRIANENQISLAEPA